MELTSRCRLDGDAHVAEDGGIQRALAFSRNDGVGGGSGVLDHLFEAAHEPRLARVLCPDLAYHLEPVGIESRCPVAPLGATEILQRSRIVLALARDHDPQTRRTAGDASN